MKSNYNIGITCLMLVLGAMGLSLASCSNDDTAGNDDNASVPVKVNITTRAENGSVESPWTANDVVTLQGYKCDETAKSQSATCQWDGSNWSITGGLYWASYQTPLDFMGYYPTTATADGLEFTIPADQSDAAKLHAADYMTTDRMYGVSNTGNTGNTIDFAFSHRLVKIIINVVIDAKNESNVSFSDATIVSAGNKATVTSNNKDNTTKSAVTTSGDVQKITPLVGTNESGATTYTAIVAPCTLTSGSTDLMFFTFNGVLRNLVYSGDLTALESGKAYTFNLKMVQDEVEISSVTVNNWEDVSAEDYEDSSLTLSPDLSLTEMFTNDSYQSIRKRITTLTLNLDEVTTDQRNNYLQKFANYFPNVTTLIVSGTTIPLQDMFNTNKNITTMVCDNLETIKPAEYAFQHMDALEHVSFAKLKDFGNATKIFYYTDNITDIAFGTEDEMTTNTDKAFKNIFNGPMGGNNVASKITTLYLNENGYEYLNNVDLTNKTWRGITFKDIKKYSEYPYNVE